MQPITGLRTAVADHLLAPAGVPRSRRCISMPFVDRRPRAGRADIDLLVFHTTFLAQRWQRDVFRSARRNGSRSAAWRVPASPFRRTSSSEPTSCDFLRDFDVRYVLSCARESEWPKIYRRIDPMPGCGPS
jgi:hypothetical protein